MNIVRALKEAAISFEKIKAMKEAFQAVEFIHEGRPLNDESDGLMKRSIYESLGRHVWLSFPIGNL